MLAIHELKARYGDLVDSRFERGRLKDEDDLARIADAIAATFTEDGVWDGGPALGTATGRAEIAARLATSPLTFSRHLFVKPQIQVDDEATRATGRWDILAPCTFADGSTKWMSGVEDDVYARGTDGVWRHERMTLTTVFLAPSSEGWGRIFA
ncbi:MAG: nuclear transport factor 2 family protein [Acidimicrobiales bacterium]|nr:nuclear transport factor 2 family protein [Acidimicrobiales bacterium]